MRLLSQNSPRFAANPSAAPQTTASCDVLSGSQVPPPTAQGDRTVFDPDTATEQSQEKFLKSEKIHFFFFAPILR